MIYRVCFVTFAIAAVLPGALGWYNAVLEFPGSVSIENYVLLRPDFTDATSAISVCSWIKPVATTATFGVWFSYQVPAADDNEIGLSDDLTQFNIMFKDNLNIPDTVISKHEWHHFCLSWSFKRLQREMYLDGELVGAKATAAGRTLALGGTLVLGQDQDAPGGSFEKSQAFGGQLYELNIFHRALSATEIKNMHGSGRCKKMDVQLNSDILLGWEDILRAQRHGEMRMVEGTCSNWNMVRGLLDDDLLDHLLQFHPF